MSVKKRAKQIYHKGHHHAKKIAQRGTAIMFALILFCGILLPSGIGYAMDKMDGVAVNALVASSVEVNNSLFSGKSVYYRDGANRYQQDVVSLDGYDYFIVSTSNARADSCGPLVYSFVGLNSTKFMDVDKLTVRMKCVEDNNLLNGSELYFVGELGGSGHINLEYDNETGYWVADVPITPGIILKKPNQIVVHFCSSGNSGKLVGKTVQFRVEAYDAKGLDANSTKTMFLAGSGILMLIAGLCATPWINPSEIARKKGWL